MYCIACRILYSRSCTISIVPPPSIRNGHKVCVNFIYHQNTKCACAGSGTLYFFCKYFEKSMTFFNYGKLLLYLSHSFISKSDELTVIV